LGLWKPRDLIFNWYRPWSRELHYWVLLHVAGLREPAYHLASFVLWLGVMALYFVLARRVVGKGAAGIAVACLAALALWGGPILWVAGAQDLWMLLFALATLLAVARGHSVWAMPYLLLALLSKETAAAVPAIAVAMLCIVDRLPMRAALRRTSGLWAILVTWMVLHPTLRLRLFGSLQHSMETEQRPGPFSTAIKTLLAQFNLDASLTPEHGWMSVLARGVMVAALLASLVYFATRGRQEPSRWKTGMAFGFAWAILGWWILFLPSIGWHAYYGVLGSMGFWLAVGALLDRHRRLAIPVVVALAILREGEANAISWDWSSAWYQARAGRILDSLRARLLELHPTLPEYSRLFFAEIPNNIGFLAGDGPALRIWYLDTTLRAMYFSDYEPRLPSEPGSDYFFLFDSLRALDEIHPGETSSAVDPRWRREHGLLASLFIHSGNPAGAATEYASLSRLSAPDALYAAASFEASDQPESALVYRRIADQSLGDSTVSHDFPELVAVARAKADSALWRRLVRRSGIKPNPASSKVRRQ
jgi:hypothetical protein